MTRRSSVRAQARRNYRVLAGKAANASTPTPNPSPQGGGEKKETKLTKRVRALYEDSAVPVREIARLAGVTERTLYKYVEKHNWKRRYRVVPRGEAAARANRGRVLQPLPGFAPVKGAGGRFIRREDKDKPIAVGLKATDPAGARHAAAACGGGAYLAAVAQAKAEEAQRLEQKIFAMEWINSALKNLREHREARVEKGLGVDRIERVLTLAVNVALNRWESLLAEDERRAAAPPSARAARWGRRRPDGDARHR